MGYDMKATSRSRKARHGWPTGGHSSAVPKLALRPYGAAEDLVAGHRASQHLLRRWRDRG
jgi:hypothetical protein